MRVAIHSGEGVGLLNSLLTNISKWVKVSEQKKSVCTLTIKLSEEKDMAIGTEGDGNCLGKRLRFYLGIKKALNIFDDIDYSVITGGFVQNRKKLRDVDIITVLPNITIKTIQKVVEFAKKHVACQLNNGFQPDLNFPTDVLSRQQITDAIHGRSLEIVEEKLNLKKYTLEEIMNCFEADYRIWMYEMITHDFDMIDGNFQVLVKDTMIALRTIFLYSMSLFQYKEKISIEQIRSDLFSSAGLEYKLGEKQCRYLLIMLEREKFGIINHSGIISFNFGNINKAIERLKKDVKNQSMNCGKHFYSWQILRKGVEDYKKYE